MTTQNEYLEKIDGYLLIPEGKKKKSRCHGKAERIRKTRKLYFQMKMDEWMLPAELN